MKNKVQVTIEGKTFTISGEESELYIKKVADYINSKFSDIKKKEEPKGVGMQMISILTTLNIADEYFKERDKNIALSEKVNKLKCYEGFTLTKEEVENLKVKFKEAIDNNSKLTQEIESVRNENKEIANLRNQIAEANDKIIVLHRK